MPRARLLPALLLTVTATAVLTACGTDSDVAARTAAASALPASLASASPAPVPTGLEVTADPDAMAGVNLHVVAAGFRWAPEHASGPAVAGEGHAHVYVDGKKIGRLYGEWTHLPMTPGRHQVRVSLNGNDHRDLVPPVERTVTVTVPAPMPMRSGH